MKKIELLSPAGNFLALQGVINAGADAVYLGGSAYGARAYAENFTTEEICNGIRMAHVFGVKIYLTVNTLVKEREMSNLYDFLLPYYNCGLDGVIVQDLGVLQYIRRHFQGLKICASTQMTLTGVYGAIGMKEEGCDQIVPARELSLDELTSIHEKIDIKVETFIHGAMCYCYSGQCLLSSILGGRSGNRGRCAQPCRLPYEVDSSTSCYPLSMRDMCTINALPKLIDSGISSFKIEGRMKKPEYAAGVTAIYRKYIDLYYQNPQKFQIEKEDMDLLNSLYIRSETGEGYYFRKNGKEMITLDSPAYSPTDESLLSSIEEKYLKSIPQREVNAKIILKAGETAKLQLFVGEIIVSCEGQIVQEAMKQPLTEEKIVEQIQKCGNTYLKICKVQTEVGNNIFMTISSLNELRRSAISLMEEKLIEYNGLDYPERQKSKTYIKDETDEQLKKESNISFNNPLSDMQVCVKTKGQLYQVMKENVNRIYLEVDMITEEILGKIAQYRAQDNHTVYMVTPYIVRQKEYSELEQIASFIDEFDGILIRNLESFYYFQNKKLEVNLVLDTNLYIWNKESLKFFREKAKEYFLPTECNIHEWKDLLQENGKNEPKPALIAYGRIPMMISANCVKRTIYGCENQPKFLQLKDRYNKIFPVYTDCKHCYNIIYNSVPTSLHKIFQKKDISVSSFRLDFTTEDEKTVSSVIRYFCDIMKEYREPDYKEYTTGHYKRGVE